MNELEQESRPPFAPGFEPVSFTQEQLNEVSNYIQGAKVSYAHEMKKFGCIQMRFKNRFIGFNELAWYAKEHDLYVDTIYALDDDTRLKQEDDPDRIQVNFYRGWRNPFE